MFTRALQINPGDASALANLEIIKKAQGPNR